MEILQIHQERMLEQVEDTFFRYLYQQIPWSERMVAIKGLRGVGKTTMVLQYLKYELGSPSDALYITADHPWFYHNNLFETVESFVQMGGKILIIDEIHKYKNWSRELKNIYDAFGQLSVVFTASSALDIYRGEADLSRRVLTYELPGLSFREYLELQYGVHLSSYTLDDILKNHVELCRNINKNLTILPLFKEYLQFGYLPIIADSRQLFYHQKLNNIINNVLEYDISFIEGYTTSSIVKIKKLLGVIADSVPFEPNISAIARKMKIGRDTVNNYLHHLEKGRILNLLIRQSKGIAALQKPDKIYLENPNFHFVLKPNPNIGTLRESFLLNQLVNIRKDISLPDKGDFYLQNEGHVIEVGGKKKSASQIKDHKNAIIAADDIEYGFAHKIPLWLFGFLY